MFKPTAFVRVTILLAGAHWSGGQPVSSGVFTCGSIWLGQPGTGVAYKGTLRNSDYGFSAVIPRGYTGWGAGEGAPFHGFAIYLDDSYPRSCVVFQIGRKVDLPDDPSSPTVSSVPEKVVKVGNRRGSKSRAKGVIDGVDYENTTVNLALPRGADTILVTVTLVTPREHARTNQRIFGSFLSELRFQ